jgi:hypothetical protein
VGDWQHYLPAAFIGGFSKAQARRLRESLVWVAIRGQEKVFPTKAANVGAANQLYTLTGDSTVRDEGFVDAYWNAIEPRIPDAIGELIDTAVRTLDAGIWADTILPFVAHTFARDIGFDARLPGRVGPLSEYVLRHPNNAKLFRLREAQTLYGTMIRSEWIVLHAPRSTSFITNDLARAPATSALRNLAGYIIPLRRDAALLLKRGIRRPQFWPHERLDRWVMGGIKHMDIDTSGVTKINGALARFARRDIYGGERVQIDALRRQMGVHAPDPQAGSPHLLTPSDREAKHFSQLLLFVLTFLGTPPSVYEQHPDPVTTINWERVARVLPVVFLPAEEPRDPFLRKMAANARALPNTDVSWTLALPLRPGMSQMTFMELGSALPRAAS